MARNSTNGPSGQRLRVAGLLGSMGRVASALSNVTFEPFSGTLQLDGSNAGGPTHAVSTCPSTAEVAEELRVSRGTVYGLIGGGGLTSIKLGSSRRVARSAMLDWIRMRGDETR